MISVAIPLALRTRPASRNGPAVGYLDARRLMSTINNFDWTGLWARPRVLFGEGSAYAGGRTLANFIWLRGRCSFNYWLDRGPIGRLVHAAIHCPTTDHTTKRDT
jgi:hypothetical protein